LTCGVFISNEIAMTDETTTAIGGKHCRRVLFAAAFAFILIASACGDKPAPVKGASAINVYLDPVQEPCASTEAFQRKITNGSVTMAPVAAYRIAGTVMSKRKYTHGWGSEVAPFDLAIVWGMLTYPQVQKQLSIKHDSLRMAYFRIKGKDLPVDMEYAASHGSNNHIIPASDAIFRAVDRHVKVHDKIVLEGYLVNVEGRNTEQRISMKTSLTREDEGRGACEIIYVTRVQVENKIYE
jgi:hypothetical protein